MPTASSSLDRIGRLCRGPLTAKKLREEVVAEVRRVVPFDAYLFALTDPVTRVGHLATERDAEIFKYALRGIKVPAGADRP